MSIGFKEWALVCEALGSGEQTVLLRKGGIAEGRDGFRFKHEEFFLFPTLFHEQVIRTRLPAGTALPPTVQGKIKIKFAARVEWTELVTDLELVRSLEPFHILGDEIVQERFRYDDQEGLNVAFARAYRLSRPWVLEDSPKFGGCRSWLNLPEPPDDLQWQPVLDDAAHAEKKQALEKTLRRESAW